MRSFTMTCRTGTCGGGGASSGRAPSTTRSEAAYQVLYHVLVRVCQLLAPVMPFITEHVYQNLVRGVSPDAPISVHLTRFPEPDPALAQPDLEADVEAARRVLSVGLAARNAARLKVRQPLGRALLVAPPDVERGVRAFELDILDELNVERLETVASLDDRVTVAVELDMRRHLDAAAQCRARTPRGAGGPPGQGGPRRPARHRARHPPAGRRRGQAWLGGSQVHRAGPRWLRGRRRPRRDGRARHRDDARPSAEGPGPPPRPPDPDDAQGSPAQRRRSYPRAVDARRRGRRGHRASTARTSVARRSPSSCAAGPHPRAGWPERPISTRRGSASR